MPGAGDSLTGARRSATGSPRRSRPASRRSSSGSTPIPPACGPTPREATGEQRERLAVALVDTRRRRAARPSPAPAAAEAAAAVLVHCRALIDAAGPACVAVKPQLACFERLGAAGWLALEATCEHARAAGLLVLADGKRGDVPVTAAAYAQALVGSTPTPFGAVAGLGADAFTANPLLGRDALEPLVEGARAAGAGVVRARAHLQPGRRRRAGPAARHRRAAVGAPRGARRRARRGGAAGLADVGAVTGATVPEHLARMRELMPRTPFLLPGVGAQGGDVRDARARVRRRAAPAGSSPPRARSPTPTSSTAARPPTPRARRPSACAGWRGRSPDAGVSSLPMARRSPARLLAPLALVGFVVALLVVVNGATRRTTARGDERRRARPRRATATPTRRREGAQARAGPTRQAGRHAVGDRGEDGRAAVADRRSSTPSSTTRRCPSGRSSSCASEPPAVLAAAAAPPCWRSRSPPRRRAPPTRRRRRLGAERDRGRGLDRRRRLRQGSPTAGARSPRRRS